MGNLAELKELYLIGCQKLERLPAEFTGLKKLHLLILGQCLMVKNNPEDIEYCRSLGELRLIRLSNIHPIVASAAHLSRLACLHIEECDNFKWFPSSFRSLTRLKEIKFIKCKDIRNFTSTI